MFNQTLLTELGQTNDVLKTYYSKFTLVSNMHLPECQFTTILLPFLLLIIFFLIFLQIKTNIFYLLKIGRKIFYKKITIKLYNVR